MWLARELQCRMVDADTTIKNKFMYFNESSTKNINWFNCATNSGGQQGVRFNFNVNLKETKMEKNK